ncbi:hypothetical protein JW865_08030 [Candidatus Bathyarchaeota archaeon]|nr:hypothetical protein [Candidatus Bathyarchaeota archaeon]
MGKFYTVIGYDIYIYITGDETLIELSHLKKFLFLGSNSVWRLSPKLIYSKDVSRIFLGEILHLLNSEGYMIKDYNRIVLEQYFASGDEKVLSKKSYSFS